MRFGSFCWYRPKSQSHEGRPKECTTNFSTVSIFIVMASSCSSSASGASSVSSLEDLITRCGKTKRTNYPIGSNHRDKNARPNIYCQVLWWYESPWMQSCLNVFVAPDRQSPWACDLKQGSIFTKSKGGFHPNMANWPILQLLQPLDKIEPWQNRSTRQSVGGPRPRVASPCPPMVLSVYINESSDKVDCYRAFAMSSITSTIWSARFNCLLQGISQCIWFIADCRWYVQGVHNFEAANHWFLHVFAIQLDMLWSPKRASFLMWQR